jgi:hypothetical protein
VRVTAHAQMVVVLDVGTPRGEGMHQASRWELGGYGSLPPGFTGRVEAAKGSCAV